MADRSDSRSVWLSERAGLTALALVGTLLATLVVLPYLQYVLLGVILAYVLMPAQRRLERVIGSMAAALTLVAVAVLAILLPVMYVLAIALREAIELLTAIQEGALGMGELERQLEATGYVVDLAELYETYQEQIGTIAQGLATSGIELVTGLPGLLIGLTVTLFVLFALLRDGDRLVAWIQQVLPIDGRVQQELLVELDRLMWASVVGNVAVAAIQGIALGIGLAVLGVPAVVFLTVATFVLALLPLIGAFGVWVPVSLYLTAVGEPVGAIALVVYGSLVSASDTYLRPALIGRSSAFNAAIIVVGIFGGIVVFGAVGLFVGPVVLGGGKIILDVFARERARETGATRAPETEPADDPAVETATDTGIRADADRDSGEPRPNTHEAAPETDEASGDDVSGTDSNAGSDGATDRQPGSGTHTGADGDPDS